MSKKELMERLKKLEKLKKNNSQRGWRRVIPFLKVLLFDLLWD